MDGKAKRRRKQRIAVYGGLVAACWAFFVWQPYQIDLFERKLKPNPILPIANMALWNPANRVLVVTGHPDDSETFVGGTLLLLRKAKVTTDQVIVTDGDKGYYGWFTNATENRRVRLVEANEARKAWGGRNLDFLHYPDGRLRVNDELVEKLRVVIDREKPTHILCFDGDYPEKVSHVDHRNSGIATERAARLAGFKGWILRFQSSSPNAFVDLEDVFLDKMELIKVHKSQFAGRKLAGIQGLISSMAERHGEQAGISWAEGLRASKW